MTFIDAAPCEICGRIVPTPVLEEVNWLSDEVLERMAVDNPHWRRSNGACPACVQKALLQILLEKGDEEAHRSIQERYPLDAEAAFGALPTPLRMHADPRFTGKGVTIAFIDSGFYPHPDLVQPFNRIKAWVDAASEDIKVKRFAPDQIVTWQGWDDGMPSHWHGLMTTVTAAGNGWRSHGLYRGLASEAELVLIQVMDSRGWITNESIARALNWLEVHAEELSVGVINLSLGGDPVEPLAGNAIDSAVQRLVESGIAITVAAGNNGERRLNPPATAHTALTVGGIDDHNLFDRTSMEIWHSNYGEGVGGVIKPELVAPSIWVVAPVLPGSQVERDAEELFSKRIYANSPRAQRIESYKLVTPYYQHVDGTSFAAPLVASVIACMREANPLLTPSLIYDILIHTAHRIPGVPVDRQGYGAVEAGKALASALAERHQLHVGYLQSPRFEMEMIHFLLHDHEIEQMQVVGSWDGWELPGIVGIAVEAGVFRAQIRRLPPGEYHYKFLLDGAVALHDPANPYKVHDGVDGFNSVLVVD